LAPRPGPRARSLPTGCGSAATRPRSGSPSGGPRRRIAPRAPPRHGADRRLAPPARSRRVGRPRCRAPGHGQASSRKRPGILCLYRLVSGLGSPANVAVGHVFSCEGTARVTDVAAIAGAIEPVLGALGLELYDLDATGPARSRTVRVIV